MSSGETPGGPPSPTASTTTATPPPQQHHFCCHQCYRTISATPPDLTCPNCNSTFLEEIDNFPDSPPPNFLSSSHFTPFDHPVVDLSSLFSASALPPPPTLDPVNNAVFDPFTFLHNYLHSIRSPNPNFQFVIENSGLGEGGGGGGANLGDYFFGPGLEQLIQQLAENDPNRYGTPPAAKSAVEGLPDVELTEEELVKSDSAQCAVCMDDFGIGAVAKQMPCKHVFHKDCIVPWLELHNSCPVCRYELPTDDSDYEQRSRNVIGEGGDAPETSSGGGGGRGDGVVERWVRVSLPWPFRAPGDGSGNAGSGGVSGSGGGENANFGSETRSEDLD